jgi:O-antigen/teichoic acid export membrane protein
VAGAFAVSSALGLVLLAVVARWLEPEQNARFLTLWSLLFGIGAVLSAVDAETSRLASRATLERRRVSGQVWPVAAVGLAIGLLVLLLAVVSPGVGPVVRQTPGVLLASVATVVLFVPLCTTRGVLLGTGAVMPYAAVVLGEALLRVLVAGALWLAWGTPVLAAAVAAVAAGGLAWVVGARRVRASVEWRSADRSASAALRTVGALAVANGLSTLLLAAYPVLVTTLVGSPVGLETLFAAVILTRVPLVVVSPLQAVAVPWATRALHDGGRARLRGLWAGAAAALVALVVVAGLAGWYLGPWALRVFQGGGYAAAPWTMAVLLGATCVLAFALPQLAVVVAAERHSHVTLTWTIAVAAAAAWLVWGPGAGDVRGTVAYAVGAALVYATSSVTLLSATRTPSA